MTFTWSTRETAHRVVFGGRLAVVLAGWLATVAPIQAQQGATSSRAEGWVFTWSLSASADGREMSAAQMLLDVAVWRGSVRISVRSGALRLMTGDNGAIVMRAADSVLSVINPARREVLQGTAAEIGAFGRGAGGSIPLVVSDVGGSVQLVGVAPELEGFAARRVDISERYSLTFRAPTMQRTVRTEQVITLDVSRAVDRLDPGFRAFAERFAGAIGVPGAVRDALRAVERRVPAGFPIRSVNVATTISADDTVRTVTRSVVTGLKRAVLDTTGFVVPAGYRVTEMRRLLQPRRQP